MASVFLPLCLALVFPPSRVFTDGEETALHSNLPFRYELELLANEFQENLRRELSLLEMSMYEEFLKLVKEIDSGHRNVTEELAAELTLKVSDVMAKFEKVKIYSTGRLRVLSAKMKNLKDSMMNWVETGHIWKQDPSTGLGRRRAILGGNGDRGKRHTVTFQDDLVIKDVLAAKKLLELDPEDFPVVDDMDDIDALLEKLEDFDDEVENQGSEFVLREFAPDAKHRYVLARKNKTGEGSKIRHTRNVRPRNCYDLLKEGNTQNGVYLIYPSGMGEGVEVWCNQGTDGGGWTVIINRKPADPHLNFTATHAQYVDGFGKASSNYWIGLEFMHQLTRGKSYILRIDIRDYYENMTYATYDTFRVGDDGEDFTLEVDGYNPASTADDALSMHSGMPFVFPLPPSSDDGCSRSLAIGWWFLEYPLCFQALATGPLQDSKSGNDTIGREWSAWKGNPTNIQTLSFMIRPSTG